MEIKKAIGENLKKLKKEFGLKNQDLAEIMGVTRQTVADFSWCLSRPEDCRDL